MSGKQEVPTVSAFSNPSMEALRGTGSGTAPTDEMFGIQEIKFDPTDHNIIYACTTDGLWRSVDAGVNWTRLLNITYVSDVVINGSTLVVAVGNLGNTLRGIYRSTNNGGTWTKISSGLPTSINGYIKFGWVASDPATIVATISNNDNPTTELYRSTNTGSSWTGLTSTAHIDYQYWFAHDVAINPSNTNRMFMMGVTCRQITIGSGSASVGGAIHADVHDIEFDPSNPAIAYVACDGGVYKCSNTAASTPSFTEKNTGLAATQFYCFFGCIQN